MSIESIVQSLEAAEAHKLAEERRSRAELGELLAAMDERERRKSGLSPEEWADLKRETASAREALRAARQQAKEQRGTDIWNVRCGASKGEPAAPQDTPTPPKY